LVETVSEMNGDSYVESVSQVEKDLIASGALEDATDDEAAKVNTRPLLEGGPERDDVSMQREDVSRIRFTRNMAKFWQRITGQFPFVRWLGAQQTRLCRAGSGTHISRLLSFPVTRDWRSFATFGGDHVIYPNDGFVELAEVAKGRGLSYSDFLVYLCCNLGHDCGCPRTEVGERLQRAQRLVSGRTEEREVDGEEDEEEVEEREYHDRQERRGEWAQDSALPLFYEEDADLFRGIAAAAELERFILGNEGWPGAKESTGGVRGGKRERK
jgi:hypothetical protein